jgi:hypothetical protein
VRRDGEAIAYRCSREVHSSCLGLSWTKFILHV